MSSTIPGPIGPATAAKRGTMSAADKTKLDAYPSTPASSAVSAVTAANGLTLTTGTLAMAAAADGVAGALTTGAQEVSGAKTFLASLTAAVEAVTALVRAVGVSLVLRSSLGAGASDKCVVVGSSETAGGTNANATLLSVGAGIGGSYVESLAILKGGLLVHGGARLDLSDTFGARLLYGNKGWSIGGSSTLIGTPGNIWAANLTTGAISVLGTDSSAAPGAATVAKPGGKNAIALGASSVVITNSLVTAASVVLITPHARDATCKELIAVPAAGSFTVSGSANATAALPFSWEVKGLL